MANLNGQNIGTNYKGILNLNTLNGNLSGTLQAVTDGDGNASALELSTSLSRISANLTIGGSTTASARLHVRGDGTNPIARFEDGAGTERLSIPNAGAITANSDITIGANNAFNTGSAAFSGTGSVGALYWAGSGSNGRVGVSANGVFIDYAGGSKTNTSGTIALATLTSGFAAAAGSANFRPLNLAYTINNSGAQTGTATGIFLNATPTALDGMTHNLMDLQSGGASRFRVAANGQIFTSDAIFTGGGLRPTSGSNIVLRDSGGTTFGLLQLGGTTNAFPAIKRNASSAAIDFRLADDSTFCAVNTNTYRLGDTANTITKNSTIDGINILGFGGVSLGSFGFQHSVLAKANCFGVGVGTSILASAALQVDSTTKGFLPPRMTTTEKNAIATPASGLVVYDSTLNKLAVYTGSAWETVTSI